MKKGILKRVIMSVAGLLAIVCGTLSLSVAIAEQDNSQEPVQSGLHYSDMFTTNEYASLKDGVTYKGQTGLQVTLSSTKAKVQYQGVVDLRDNDTSAPLFELIFSPQKVGTVEMQYLTFTFTDYADPSNYLVYQIYGLVNQYPNVVCVSSYGNGQSMYKSTGVSYPSSMVGTKEYPLAIYFDTNTLETKAWPSKWGSKEDRNTLDPIRDLDACSGTGWVNKEEPAWEGLQSGLYNLTITANTVLSTSASFVLLGVDGLAFNAEEATIEDERVSCAIDYASYDKDALPYGVVGLGYEVREAKAISNFGGELGNVLPMVVDGTGKTVPVVDGKFYPQKAGIYFVLYEVTTDLGNTYARRYSVQVKPAYDEEISYMLSEKMLSNAYIGDTIFLYEGISSGGSGRLEVKNEVFFNGEVVATQNEGYYDFFIPTQTGEYVVKTVIKDYLGTTEVFEHNIQVTNKVENLTVGYVPKAVIKGQTFTIPQAYYMVGDEAKEVTVKLNGEDYSANTYIPQSSFTLSYSYGNETQDYTIQVQDGTNAKGFVANYFYTENGNITFNKTGVMELNARSGNSSFAFIRSLRREVVGFSLKLIEGMDNFQSIDFCLQDGEDKAKSVVFSFVKEVQQDETVKYFIVMNGGLNKVEFAGDLFASIYAISFDYDKSEFTLADGTVLGKVQFYENMRRYEGLSENVYVSLKVNGVVESAKLQFITISNQQLMNYEEDFTMPQFIWVQEFKSLEQKQLNEQYTTRKILGYDVLDEQLQSSVTVRYNGKPIYNGSADEAYTFTLDSYGTYTVVYELVDGNRNNLRATVTIAVLDNVAPELSLMGKYKTSVSVGDKVTLATGSVSDNVSDSKDIKIYYIIRNLKTGKEVVLSKNEYTAEQKGKYTVRVLAIDETGNVSSVEYTLEVK